MVILIATLSDLLKIGYDAAYPLSGNYRQTANIDFGSYATAWPFGIGSSSSPFTGTYDGNGFVISYSGSTTLSAGLFNYINGATLKNIVFKLNSASITYDSHTGGIVSYANGTNTLTNCDFHGGIEATLSAGGLIGTIASGTTTMSWCHVTSITGGSHDIYASSNEAGGLVGYVGGTAVIQYCGAGYSTTGLFGSCLRVHGNADAGGIIGKIGSGASATITSCFVYVSSDGRIYNTTSGGSVGGLWGVVNGSVTFSYCLVYGAGSINGSILLVSQWDGQVNGGSYISNGNNYYRTGIANNSHGTATAWATATFATQSNYPAGYVFLPSSGASPSSNYWQTNTTTGGAVHPKRFVMRYWANIGTYSGDTYDSNLYYSGSVATILSNGFSSSYTFNIWNTSSDGTGTNFSPGATTTVGASQYADFYAQWTILYTITYNMNGGTPQIPSASAYAGDPYTISSTVPTKTGYSFLTWSMAIGGTSSNYSPGQTITMPAQNITFIAVWGSLYQITYSAADATGGTVPVDSNYYGVGSAITLAYNTGGLVRTGYVFIGWQYNSVRYAQGATIYLAFGQYTVYAVWSQICSIVYYGNNNTGGTAPVDSNQYYIPLNGSMFSFTVLSRGDLTRTGYYFIGWSTSASAQTSEYDEGGTYTVSHTLYLYAVWVGNAVISVTAYPTDGGTVSGGGTYTPGDTVTVIASANAGYAFDGWYVDDVEVSSDATYVFVASDTRTLVAHFINLSKLEISADRTRVYVDVGSTEIVNITTNTVGTVFSVAEGTGVTVDTDGVVSITGYCPAGYYRVQILATVGIYAESVTIEVFIATPTLPAINGRERVTIFNPNGGYVSFADDSVSLALSNLSEIRYEEDAPRKAIVTITNNWTIDEDNIRSASYAGWSDGYVGPVIEGMQMVIDKMDTLQKQQVRVINSTINKIAASGITVTITAYDALLALSEFRSPFLLYGSYVEEKSYDLEIVSTDYDYTMIAEVNTLIGASLIDTKMDEATFSGTPDVLPTTMWAFSFDSSHGPSHIGGTHKIRRLSAHIVESANLSYRVKIYAGDTVVGGPIGTPVFTSEWYTASSGSVVDHVWECGYQVYQDDYLYYALEIYNSGSSSSPFYGPSSKFESNDFWVWNYNGITVGWQKVGVSIFPGNTVWPTVEVEYEDTPRVIDISSVTISGTDIIVVPDSIAINTSAYDSAIAIIATFFSSGRPASAMVADLIRRAGLYTDGLATPTKSLSYYDTSSYDYLTCVQDLIGAAADSGEYQGSLMTVQASVVYPRMILCRYKHRITDTPYIAITAAPFGAGYKIIRSHTLQRTFETETSRPIILSKLNTNDAPIALQTDDLLYGTASLEARLGYRTISITTDNTLQTHAALSMSAETLIKKAHRNTLEGQAALTKITPLFWSGDGDTVYGAGQVLALDVPQYGAVTNAITRIMTIKGYFTTIDLDNVRLDNRTIINQSISRGQDAQTYAVATLPSSAYIFVRMDDVISENIDDYVSVTLIDQNDDLVAISTIIRLTTDNASPDTDGGYVHVSALFDISETGYATTAPVKYVQIHTLTQTYTELITEPVYAWPGQYIHMSARGRRT